jgi:pimeloyl-ACP methyl ester carboxylesterase
MTYFSAPRQPAPVIIFFHDEGQSSAQWTTLGQNLQSRGYNVFVPDQRGHGRSEGTIDWLRAIEDVDVYLQTIDQLPIRIQDIMMIGVGEGANVALVSCARSNRCIAAAAISPREFVPAINLDSIVGSYGESRQLLLVSADDDTTGSSINNQLQEQVTADAVEWQRYSGGGRGLTLFENQSNLSQVLVGWLRNQAQPIPTLVPAQ